MAAVTLEEAKAHIGIAHSAQDAVVETMIAGAEDWIARECGICLAETTCEEDLDGGGLFLRPSCVPVTALESVADNLGQYETVYAAIVRGVLLQWADADGRPLARPWPDGIGRWRVAYTAGYASPPAGLRSAILALVYRAYNARGGETGSSAQGANVSWGRLADSDIREMLRPYRRTPSARV
ncbi:MAG: phage gp6-like head-tail connector protein [Planctomycetota bacterium]|nr:phage gp6-like head-tail connector protein [Planctomycetota bacterium]